MFKKYIHNSSVENVKKRLVQEELIDNKISRKEILHITAIESQNDFFRLQSHFSYFRNWDEGMLFFLDFNLKNNFKSFLNRYGKELLLHTIGLNVYLETSELDLHYTEKLHMVASIKNELLKKCNEFNSIRIQFVHHLLKFKTDREIIEHTEPIKDKFFEICDLFFTSRSFFETKLLELKDNEFLNKKKI